MTSKTIAVDTLVRKAIKAMLDNYNLILCQLKYNPEGAFEQIQIASKDPNNTTTRIDLWAERQFRAQMYKSFGDIRVYGEESLQNPDLDLSNEEKTVAIVDMVDGTDLLTYGISLWCSAIVFFLPRERRIVAAFVGDAFGRIYYALGEGRTWVTDPALRNASIAKVMDSAQKIRPNIAHRRLEESFLCFYGQKPERLKSVAKKTSLLDRVHRIYNFAGNPMMAKVADGSMSGVFELKGQKPHDFVPGAFIAKCAGATLRDLSGEELDLVNLLCRPAHDSSRQAYVLCCTEELTNAVLTALGQQGAAPPAAR